TRANKLRSCRRKLSPACLSSSPANSDNRPLLGTPMRKLLISFATPFHQFRKSRTVRRAPARRPPDRHRGRQASRAGGRSDPPPPRPDAHAPPHPLHQRLRRLPPPLRKFWRRFF